MVFQLVTVVISHNEKLVKVTIIRSHACVHYFATKLFSIQSDVNKPDCSSQVIIYLPELCGMIFEFLAVFLQKK